MVTSAPVRARALRTWRPGVRDRPHPATRPSALAEQLRAEMTYRAGVTGAELWRAGLGGEVRGVPGLRNA